MKCMSVYKAGMNEGKSNWKKEKVLERKEL